MLAKLAELNKIANSLWHEDVYAFTLSCSKANVWNLTVLHSYKGKTSPQPDSVIFHKAIADDNAEAVIAELKASFIVRAQSLAEFRKADCDKAYERMKQLTEEFTKRLFVLEELKKI